MRKIFMLLMVATTTLNIMAQQKIVQTAGHGAAKDSWFAHLAFGVPGEETENVWLEPVTDEEYNKLQK